MANSGGNGWRSGTDPILRWLRTAAVVGFLLVAIVVSLDRDRDVTGVVPVLGLAVGAILILLGYQGVVRIPGISRDDDDHEP